MLLRITKLSLQLFNRAYRRLCLLMLWKGGGKKSYLACIRLNTYTSRSGTLVTLDKLKKFTFNP